MDDIAFISGLYNIGYIIGFGVVVTQVQLYL